ncbi:hypothetical protein MNBD_ALPHA04-469, partial [hydrothermal vent metagenome]
FFLPDQDVRLYSGEEVRIMMQS